MLATILFALLATNAMASLIAYEPYNYTLATAPTFVSGTPTQTTGGGFSSGYNGGGLTTVAGLTYSGLSTAYNALKQTAAYSGENLSSPVSSGTVYISYVFNMSGNPGGNKVGLEMNTGGNGMFVGVTTPVTGTTGKLGVNQQSGYNDSFANTWESSTANITYGSTYFIVVKLTGTGSGWTGSIWVNPTANTSSEPAPDGTFTMPQFTISACSIVNPAGAGGNFLFDELRLGTTWAEAVTYTVPAPSAPTGLAATAGGNSVVLNWTAAAGSPVSYNVKRSTTSGSGYVTVSPAGAVTDTSFTNSVVGGVTYYYVVSAVNSGGESADSSEVSAAPTLVAPDAPTGLAASASDGQVVLSWAGGIASSGYNVKRSTTSGAEVTIATSGATSYTDFTVANGTTYYYAVSATNSVGESANSAEVTASPVAYQPVYESFNYGLGSFATGTASTANGLTGNWTVGNGTIIAGLTYIGLPVSHNAIATTGNTNIEGSGNLFTYKLGALYKLTSNGNLYVNYALSQLPPGSTSSFGAYSLSSSTSSASNPSMEPQKSKTLEAGTKWEFFNQNLLLTAALFRTDVYNEVYENDDGTYSQIGKKRVQGVELSATGKITRDWDVTAAYTHQKTDIVVGAATAQDGSSTLPYAPENALSLWSSYRMPMGLTVGGGARYVGIVKRQTKLATTPDHIPAYWVYDAMASYKVSKNWDLQFNVYNLFDKHYITAINYLGYRYTPGLERSARVTVNYHF